MVVAPSPTDSRPDVLLLLARLAAQGVTLHLEGERITVNGPAAALDADLRAALQAARADLVALLKQSRTGPAADRPGLTRAQAALLPVARLYRAGGRHHVPLVAELDGRADLNRIVEALNILQDRHDALRQCFPADQDAPALRPRSARLGLDGIQHLDLGAVGDAVAQAVAQPFDLENGPLWRATAVAAPGPRLFLVLVFHHLIFDGVSRDVFLRELAAVDQELSLGRDPDRRSPAWQPEDVAAWEEAQASPARLAAARTWWRAHLTGLGAPTALPPARPNTPGGATAGAHLFSVARHGLRALRDRARTEGLPAGAVALAAVARALGALTGQEKILVTTPVMNRDHPKAAGTIGYLNRVLPLVLPTGPDNLATVGQGLLAANDHRHLPGDEITALAGRPLDRLMFGWQERSAPPEMQGRPITLHHVGRAGADFDLSVQFEAQGDSLTVRLDWAAGVLGATAAPALADRIAAALTGPALPPGPDPEALAAVLQADPAVRAAAVRTDRRSGVTTGWLELDEVCQTSQSTLLDAVAHAGGGLLPPLRLVSCATLPRRVDGSIDMDRLPEPAPTGGAVSSPPETGVQRAIAEIWQRMLMSDAPIGIDEDFRDLGGHSLLAVRMLAEVMDLTGRERLSLGMASARTIRALSAALDAPDEEPQATPIDPAILVRLRSYTAVWQGTRHSDQALIVGRNATGDLAPLFWCLQSESELAALAQHLGADQPVYGMRSGYQVMVKTPENIDRLAAHYAAEIAEIHPQGPIFLGGNCQAAVIAFDIARHLRAAGRGVDLLVLHEKMVPHPYDGRIALTFGRDSDRNPYLAEADPLPGIRNYYTGALSVDLVAGGHGQFFQEPYVLDLAGTIRQLRDTVPALRKE